jgi:hypothetical protein
MKTCEGSGDIAPPFLTLAVDGGESESLVSEIISSQCPNDNKVWKFHRQTRFCYFWIWDSHNGGYKNYFLVGCNACHLLVVSFLLGLFSELEEEGNTFFRNVGGLLLNCTTLHLWCWYYFTYFLSARCEVKDIAWGQVPRQTATRIAFSLSRCSFVYVVSTDISNEV